MGRKAGAAGPVPAPAWTAVPRCLHGKGRQSRARIGVAHVGDQGPPGADHGHRERRTALRVAGRGRGPGRRQAAHLRLGRRLLGLPVRLRARRQGRAGRPPGRAVRRPGRGRRHVAHVPPGLGARLGRGPDRLLLPHDEPERQLAVRLRGLVRDLTTRMAQPDPERSIPKAMRPTYEAVVALTDGVCAQHLDDDYARLAREMTAALCRKRPSPLASGQPRTWAGGILHELGRVNFLSDPASKPHMTLVQLAKACGIGESTASAKAAVIRQALGVNRLNPSWMLPALVESNPLTWIAEVNGLLVVRGAKARAEVS